MDWKLFKKINNVSRIACKQINSYSMKCDIIVVNKKKDKRGITYNKINDMKMKEVLIGPSNTTYNNGKESVYGFPLDKPAKCEIFKNQDGDKKMNCEWNKGLDIRLKAQQKVIFKRRK